MEGHVHVGERAPRQAPNCPYCHTEIAPDDASTWTCPGCNTAHHEACAAENRGCTLLGCGVRYDGSASVHWPDGHRATVAVEREAPPATTTGSWPLRAGGVLCALGAALVLVGALLELPGPSREAAIARAAPVLRAGAGLLGLGLAVVLVALVVGLASRARRSSPGSDGSEPR